MIRQSIVLTVLWLTALFGSSVSAQLEVPGKNAAVKARIGIVLPKAQLGQGNTGENSAEPVRQLISSYLAGPVLDIVRLEARIPAQIEAEASSRNCTHVLYTSLEQKKGGRGAGGIFSKMAPVAGVLPSVGVLGALSDSTGAIAAGIASQAILDAAFQSAEQAAIDNLLRAQAGSVRARDEFTLQYRLVTIGGATPPVENTLLAKAKEDGEDLLSQLVEQLATITVTSAVGP